MKTLYINAVSCKAGGGLNDLVHSLPLIEKEMGARGWHVATWVVPAGASALDQAGCRPRDLTVVRAESPWRRAIWETITFPQLVARGQPDVVYHFSNFIVRRLRVSQITVLRSPTFFSTDYAARRRTGWYQALRFRVGCRLSAATVRRADRVFCISEVQRRDIVGTLGSDGEKVAVSHLGVAAPPEARAWRLAGRRAVLDLLPKPLAESLRPLVDGPRRVVLNVSHYYEHKNLGDLLDAAGRAARTVPDIGLVLTAGLTQYHGPWTERTRRDVALARELAERGRLVDLGPVDKPCVWKLMAMADLFAFPSSLESFGHPLLEAMSVGLPVLAADTPIHREICGNAARYHGVADPESLARRLADMLPATATDRVEAGIQRAARFSWHRHAGDLCRAILELGGDAIEPSADAVAPPPSARPVGSIRTTAGSSASTHS